MTKQKKLLLGFLTFLPVLCIIMYCICFVLYFINIATLSVHPDDVAQGDNLGILLGNFGIMFLMMILAIVSGIGIMIYYVIHANSNPKFDSNQKLMWILVLVLAGGIGNFVYYFVEILSKETTQLPKQQ